MGGSSARALQCEHQILMSCAVPKLFQAFLVYVAQSEVSGHVVAAHEHVAAMVDDHSPQRLGARPQLMLRRQYLHGNTGL